MATTNTTSSTAAAAARAASGSSNKSEQRGSAPPLPPPASPGSGKLSYRDVLLFRASKENQILTRLQENYPEAYKVMTEAFAMVRRWRTIAAVQVGDEYVTVSAATALLRDVFRIALGDSRRNPAYLGQSPVDLAGEFAMIFRRDLGTRVLSVSELCELLGRETAADGGLSFAEPFDVQAWVTDRSPGQTSSAAAAECPEAAAMNDGAPAVQEYGRDRNPAAVPVLRNPPPRRSRPSRSADAGGSVTPGTQPQPREESSAGGGQAAASQLPAGAAAAPVSESVPQTQNKQVSREVLLECLGLDEAEREVFEHLTAAQLTELEGLGAELVEASGEQRQRLISSFKDRLYDLNG